MRIYVEANIGSGKTTFLNLLGEDYNTIKEPLDEWLKLTDGKENILDIIPAELHMRTPFYCGSKKMVQQLKKFI